MKKIIKVNEKYYSVDIDTMQYEQVENKINTTSEIAIVTRISEGKISFFPNGINNEIKK